MADETMTQVGVGLSAEEQEDLEQLVKELKQDEPVSPVAEGQEDINARLKSVSEHVAELGEVILKLDNRMKSFYEIIRLYQKKSEIVDKRIDSIMKSVRGGAP